jgi:hypothetical protein
VLPSLSCARVGQVEGGMSEGSNSGNRECRKLTNDSEEATFQTLVIETPNGLFSSSFSYQGQTHLVGIFASSGEAQVQVLLAFQRYHRTLK